MHFNELAIDRDTSALLAKAHERYMYFAGVFIDRPDVDRIARDRATYAHLLRFTDDGRPSVSDERCADFMMATTGLSRELCLAWDEADFVATHGDGFVGERATNGACGRE
jgi:hypothetical protein